MNPDERARFADRFRCPSCGISHSPKWSCTEFEGRRAVISALERREKLEAAMAVRLSAKVGEEHFYPLLSVCKVGYRARQLAQAVGKVLVEFARTSGAVGQTEVGVSGGGVLGGTTHHNLLSLHGLRTRHVTGAIFAAFRWLQGRRRVRQVAVPPPRPSDAANIGGDL